MSASEPGISAGILGASPPAADLARLLGAAGSAPAVSDEVNAETVRALVDALPAPRAVFLAQASAEATGHALVLLDPLLAAGDILVDAGEGHFREAALFAKALGMRGIGFVDLALAAGSWSGELGRVLAVGGNGAEVERLRPLLDRLAPPPGQWAASGPPGSGHFVRAMQAEMGRAMTGVIGGGLNLFGGNGFQFNPADLALMWQRGSMLNSALGEMASAFLEAAGSETCNAPPPPAIALARTVQMASQGADLYWRQIMSLMPGTAPPEK
ncbi:MAG TPA: NAD(P)-binding domain-containing protein [Burkholderiales bacterium]|nr:NAD(P)-binding domain-containing protein [Burkholderiales bacterium]